MLVVDDDARIIGDYVRSLGEDFEPDFATATLGDLEKVLLGDDDEDDGTPRFEVHSRNLGETAVEAVRHAAERRIPFGIVFIDVDLPGELSGAG